jgi:hypothetical protein
MEVTLVQETCCACGIAFWMESKFQQRLREEKRSFYCPNGHGQHYLGEADAAKARRLLQEKTELERNKDAEIEHLERALRRKCPKPRTKK